MPLSCPGKLRAVPAPPAGLPRHQPGLQLPVQPSPTRSPPSLLPSCLEPPPPCTPSSGSTTQGSSTAGGTMEATSPPGSRYGNRHRPRALPTGRLSGSAPLCTDPAGAFATHQTRPAGTGGGRGEGGGWSGSSSPLRPPQEARRQLGRSRERQQEALGPRVVRSESNAGRAAALISRGVRGALLSRAATECSKR